MYTYDSEGFFRLTYAYSEAELWMLEAATALLKAGGIDYKVIVLSNGAREIWRKPSRAMVHGEATN